MGEQADIGVIGAGAFGTALAIALARGGQHVALVARDAAAARAIDETGENAERLPGHPLPQEITVSAAPGDALESGLVLLAVPTQKLGEVVGALDVPARTGLVACCKGIALDSGHGPVGVIEHRAPGARAAILSGPSFAVDIAAGLPTALTLAARDEAVVAELQQRLSTHALRLYRTTDVAGVELGGALKNVIAIGCGVAIGAGLGESARAALMTRGYAEIVRFATRRGARAETLAGLSGFGDLALTCTSEKSRNYAFGLSLGRAGRAEPSATTEGIATARAISDLAAREGVDMPVCSAIAALLAGEMDVADTVNTLLARPLRAE